MVHEHSSGDRLSRSSYVEHEAHDDTVLRLAPRLAYFAGVARHEHVTRAAQEMGVPQSTLSRAIVRLEDDLGVALFARRGRTVSLTPPAAPSSPPSNAPSPRSSAPRTRSARTRTPARGGSPSASSTPWGPRPSRR
ncbi:LysR family transcriptional regulator [Streptomyces zhihengii]